MSYNQDWLENPSAIKLILAEVSVLDVVANSTISLYMSTTGYTTTDGLTTYTPVLLGTISTTESISMDGSSGITFGDLEISNPNGELDSYLDSTKYIWVNKPITLYLGDPLWVTANITEVHSNFLKIFDGVVNDIDSRAVNTINLKVRDKLERLNNPITEHKLGTYGTWPGGQTNQDEIVPLVFGEVFNTTPLLVNPATLEYRFNDGHTELLIELRDNGTPIYTQGGDTSGASINLTTGTLNLIHPLVGTPTVSVQGVNSSINLTTGALVPGVYSNNVANLIALIVTQYGTGQKLTSNDIDLVNFAAFASTYVQPVGVSIVDRTNVLSVCQLLATSVGAQIYMNRLGKLQLLHLGIATTDPTVNITIVDILEPGLSISLKTEVVAATKLGYCKNWTVQPDLLTSIPSTHKSWYATEWATTTAIDTTVQTIYSASGDPTQKDTALLSGADAYVEATRLNNYFKVPRTVYRFTGTSKLLSLKLGQAVNLTYPRFNLEAGKMAQVVTLTPNWLESTIEIEVVI